MEQPKIIGGGLKNLIESNERIRRAQLDKQQAMTPNGFACPQCGEELADVNPTIVVRANPAHTSVVCRKCMYTGIRYIEQA